MATWSRSQSQDAGSIRAVSSGLKVGASNDLARCEKIRLANVREAKRIARWAEEAPGYKKIRKYNHTIEVKLSRKIRRSGRVLSHEKRVAILQKASDRLEAREALFAGIAAMRG